jgi:hypothetical protein
MPDIQTAMKQALSKTLVEWDDDDAPPLPSVQPVSTSLSQPSQNIQGIPMTNTASQPHRFGVTNNVTRATFNYVRDNPGSTRKEIITALDHQGYKEGSTTSLLSQLRKHKQIHTTNGLYYVDVAEYTPIKNYKPVKKEKQILAEAIKPKRKYTKRATTEGIGALLKAKIEATPMPSQDALDAAAYTMGGNRPVLTKLVRTKSPESIVENMNVLQARELYDYLKKMFGG